MATFLELGIPFPLFEAPISEASEYAGKTACAVCGGGDRHCFKLDIGCDLVVRCPACGANNVDPEEEWYAVRVPKEHLFELLRTPTFHTWQGERWLFCCKRPMTYIGEWSNLLKSPHRPDNPREFFESATESDARLAEVLWKRMSGHTRSLCVYTFHCKACCRYRATWDMD